MENGLLKVTSLIFAGCAGFKHDLAKKLDPRVNEKILAFVDVQYGGENGFHQAIELCMFSLFLRFLSCIVRSITFILILYSFSSIFFFLSFFTALTRTYFNSI
jgi:hypothetical protein